MIRSSCRVPSPLDRQFAKEHSANEFIIANLRGLYETKTKDTINSVDEYLTKLLPFKNKLMEENKKALDNILNPNKTAVVATVVSLLKREFTNAEIQELTDLLYSNFSDIVKISLANPTGELKSFMEEMKEQGKQYSRADVIRHIGVDNILLKLVNSINALYYNPKKKATYMNPLLGKLINGNHIDTFLWLARDEIYKREGIKFGRKIKYVVEFNNDETLEADYKVEDGIKDGWMREMEKESPFRNIGQEVRSYLGRQILFHPKKQPITITDPETGITFTEYIEVPQTSKNGFRKLHDPGELHKSIQNLLTGCRDMNHMLKILERAAKEDLNMQHIYNDLVSNPKLAAAFYRDFKKTKCNFTKAYYNKAKNLIFQTIRSTSKKMSFYHYSHGFTSESNLAGTIFRHDEEGDVVIDGDKINDFKEYLSENIGGSSFENIVIQSASVTANPETEAFGRQSYMAAQQIVKTISDRLGFNLTDSQIEDLIKSKINLKSFLADAKAIANDRRLKAGMLLSDIGNGIFKDRITAMFNNINNSVANSTKSVRIGDSTYFTDIVTSKVANTVDVVKSFAADAKYALSLDSEDEQNRILEEVVRGLKSWVLENYGCSSEYYITDEDGNITGFYHDWINQLYSTTVESLKDLDSFIYQFDYDRAMLFDGILAEDFSADLDLKTFIANYFSNNMEVDSGYARYPLFTTGDSLALKFINSRKYGYNTLINKFIGVARQEIARMQLEAQVKEALEADDYSTNKIVTLANESTDSKDEVTGDFIYLKFLNRTDVKDENGKTYKERIREALKKSSPTDKTPFINVMKDILKTELFEEYKNDFLDKVKDKEVFISNEDGRFKNFQNFYGLSATNMEEDSPSNGLMMYYLNTKLAYIYQYQFLGANPAAYGLSTAMQKRYKAYNAPGNPMNIWAKDYKGNYYIKTETIINEEGKEEVVPVQQKAIYFRDTHISAEETDPDFMKALAYQWGKQALGDKAAGMSEEAIIEEGKKDSRYQMYKDNDATDGQGYRTLESYRRVMGMAEQWTEEMDNAYDRIQEMRKNTWERAAMELFNKSFDSLTADEKYQAKLKAHFTADEIDELNTMPAFQPIKPHTSTVERVSNGNGDMLLVPVEHKYAEVFLIPETYDEGSFKKLLAVEMESKGIDMACSEQCVKVGNFGAAKLTESSKGEAFKTTSENFAEEFSNGYIHTIDYADYTIQTNVPEHINASQLFGTQLRKHVFDAIRLLEAYNYGGVDAVKVHGETLHLNESQGGKAFLKFYNALICENMNSDLIELTSKLSDNGKLSELLSELKSNDFNSSIEDAMRFGLDENGNFVRPICEPSGMYDIESILTSIFKREVNKQHINGGSCVQVSDYGLSNFGTELKVHTSKDHNITTVDCAMAWDLSWTDAAGNKVPLKFSDYCNADGTLIMETRTVNGKEVTKEKIEWDYEGILDLVAYRIPTEREYSVINLRVKRFLPKVMGGVIMVPSQFVTVAGFDFDIDKLYYFRKEFKQKKELSPEEVTEVWNDIYGIKVNEETGDVDTSNATEIYHRLKDAYDEAHAKYRELTDKNEYSNTSLGDEQTAANLKAALGIADDLSENNNLPEVFKPKNRLFKYWEEAGLQEEFGKTYTEYYNEYLTKHKNKYVKFDSYDYSKDVTENSVTARNNELIKCIQSRLTSVDTFNARYTPGGFTNAKRDKRVIKAAVRGLKIPLPEGQSKPTIRDYENYVDEAIRTGNTKVLESLDEALDVTNVLTTAEYNAKNRVATKVIGIMANHNTNAVYSKAMGSLTLKEPIKIFGETLVDLNNSNTGRDYMLTLAELLASSVDAVKDPVLGDLMINSYTANVAALLARLGLSTEEIGLFLNQPIIKEVCEEAINRGDSSITKAIRRIAKKYSIEITNKYNGSSINKNDLFDSLNQEIKSKDAVQGNILNAFSNISSVAQALSDFISKTKYTAANSIDNTIGGLIALIYDNKAANEQETLINKHLVMSFSGFSSQKVIEEVESLKSPIIIRKDLTLESMQKDDYKKFLDATPFAFEQMVHDAVRAYIKKLGRFFPYTTPLYEGVYDSIYSNIVFGQMDQEIVDAVNRQFPVYMLNTKPESQFNPDFNAGEGTINNKKFFTIKFPEQLRDFLEDRKILKEAQDKEKEFKVLKEKYDFLNNTSLDAVLENDLLDKLVIEEYVAVSDDVNLFEESGVRFNITIEGDSQFNKDVKNSLISSWDALVKDKDLKVNNSRESLAHALFMYNFYTRGYEVGRNAFSNITPLSVADTLMVDSYVTYSDFYRALVAGNILSINPHRFLPLFYANNIDNNKLVASIYSLTTDNRGNIIDANLPTGRVKAEFGKPTTIEFDAGSKQNYDAITLPNTKRSGDMKNKRILVPAFKIVDRFTGTRLFILSPNASTDGYNFASPMYNVRSVNSKVSYIEVPIKGISNTTVDYSMEDINLLLTTFKDDGDNSDVGKSHEPYVDPSKKAIIVDPNNVEELQEELIYRQNIAREKRKEHEDC